MNNVLKSIARNVTSLMFAPIFALMTGAAAADVLLIEAIHETPANGPGGLERPRQMMTMAEVEARYGAPQQRVPAVGEPPITRWVYSGYTVYFEHQYVLNTVVHPDHLIGPMEKVTTPAQPESPAPAQPDNSGA